MYRFNKFCNMIFIGDDIEFGGNKSKVWLTSVLISTSWKNEIFLPVKFSLLCLRVFNISKMLGSKISSRRRKRRGGPDIPQSSARPRRRTSLWRGHSESRAKVSCRQIWHLLLLSSVRHFRAPVLSVRFCVVLMDRDCLINEAFLTVLANKRL